MTMSQVNQFSNNSYFYNDTPSTRQQDAYTPISNIIFVTNEAQGLEERREYFDQELKEAIINFKGDINQNMLRNINKRQSKENKIKFVNGVSRLIKESRKDVIKDYINEESIIQRIQKHLEDKEKPSRAADQLSEKEFSHFIQRSDPELVNNIHKLGFIRINENDKKQSKRIYDLKKSIELILEERQTDKKNELYINLL